MTISLSALERLAQAATTHKEIGDGFIFTMEKSDDKRIQQAVEQIGNDSRHDIDAR